MKMATKSHEGKCGPCHLCEQESTRYTHLDKMDCVVAKLICDIFMQRSVYIAMHATNKHREMLITFQPRWKPKQDLSVVLIHVVKLFTETRTWLLENKLKI